MARDFLDMYRNVLNLSQLSLSHIQNMEHLPPQTRAQIKHLFEQIAQEQFLKEATRARILDALRHAPQIADRVFITQVFIIAQQLKMEFEAQARAEGVHI